VRIEISRTYLFSTDLLIPTPPPPYKYFITINLQTFGRLGFICMRAADPGITYVLPTNHNLSAQTITKYWFLLEICEVRRDCSYLPTGTLRRSSSKKFLPRQSARGLRRNRVWCQQPASLFPRRNFLLQFFKPILHHHDLRGGLRLLDGLEHQKALAVGRHIVVRGRSRGWRVLSFEQHPGLA
jgi:hypothetical protein